MVTQCPWTSVRDVLDDEEPDSTLVCRAKQNPAAFGPLYERYQDGVRSYAYRSLGDWEDAADVTQQTFAQALAGLNSFQDRDDSFRSWLFRIARNEVINLRRQHVRRREHGLQSVDWMADPGTSPEDQAIATDERAVTRAEVLRLPLAQRQCCVLRFAGLSHRETADRLGKSEVAVRASYSRGLAALRTVLTDPDTRCLA